MIDRAVSPAPAGPDEARGSAGDAPRLHWVDTAKALAIILVVIYHVSLTGSAYLLPGSTDWGAELWRGISTYLLPVRMPLFFLVSGVLAVQALGRPWGLLGRRRFADLLWPFVLWSLAYGPAYGWGYGHGPGDPWGATLAQWEAAAYGGSAYWYLTTLVAFFLVARLLRSHGAVVLVLSFVAWLGATSVDDVTEAVLPDDLVTTLTRLCWFGVWFFLGCFARPLVESVAGARGRALPLVSALGFVAAAAWLYGIGGAPEQWSYGASVLGVLTFVLASVRLARSSRVREWSAYLARRTLPIYVVHPLILTLVVWLTRDGEGRSGVEGGSPILGFLFTPVVSALLIAAAIGIHRLAGMVGVPWLFQAPTLRRPST